MKIAFLRQLSLFSHLKDSTLEAIATNVEQKKYLKHELVFYEGKRANEFFIICDGSVKIFKLDINGNEYVLRIASKNDTLAVDTIFIGNKYPTNCITLTNTVLFTISSKQFISLIKNDHQLALNILSLQAANLMDLSSRIEQLSLGTTRQKFLNFLFKNTYMKNNISATKTQGLSIQNLANYLGTTRENLSRTISKLIKDNVIKQHKTVLQHQDYNAN